MRIPASTYFKSLQWIGLLTLFLFSIFVHRPTALLLFGGLLVWKVYIQWQLPARLLSRLDGGRLNNSRLQSSLKPIDTGVKTRKTKLHYLTAPWPTVLLLEKSGAHVFFSHHLAKKLSPADLKVLSSLLKASFDSDLPRLGLGFYGYSSPFLKSLRWVDRHIKVVNLEGTALRVLCLIAQPLQRAWDEAWNQAAQEHSQEDCWRLRRILSNLIAAHHEPLPGELAFLSLDTDLAIPKRESIILEWPQIQHGKSKGN